MAYDKTKPTYAGGPVSDFDAIKTNFVEIYRKLLMDGDLSGLTAHTIAYTYDGSNNLTGIVVKDGSSVTQASCTLTYTGGNLTLAVWTFPVIGGTYTYTYSYSGVNLTGVALAIT